MRRTGVAGLCHFQLAVIHGSGVDVATTKSFTQDEWMGSYELGGRAVMRSQTHLSPRLRQDGTKRETISRYAVDHRSHLRIERPQNQYRMFSRLSSSMRSWSW